MRYLDSAIHKGRIPHGLVVYRALNDPDVLANMPNLVGKVYRDDAYLSTTLLAGVAATHARRQDHPMIVEIRVTSGTKAAYVSLVGTRRGTGEFELLLPRGIRMRVLSSGTIRIDRKRYPHLVMDVIS